MNEDKLILSNYSSGYFVSSVKENKKWNDIESRYKISKEIYEDIEKLQNNWNELKKLCKETIENVECTDLSEDYLMGCEDILKKMQELEGNNDR